MALGHMLLLSAQRWADNQTRICSHRLKRWEFVAQSVVYCRQFCWHGNIRPGNKTRFVFFSAVKFNMIMIIFLFVVEVIRLYKEKFQNWHFKICRPFKHRLCIANTVDLVIFACLNFREFVILRLFARSRLRELSILMIGSAIIIIIALLNTTTKLVNRSSSRNLRKLKLREYYIYHIYSIAAEIGPTFYWQYLKCNFRKHLCIKLSLALVLIHNTHNYTLCWFRAWLCCPARCFGAPEQPSQERIQCYFSWTERFCHESEHHVCTWWVTFTLRGILQLLHQW